MPWVRQYKIRHSAAQKITRRLEKKKRMISLSEKRQKRSEEKKTVVTMTDNRETFTIPEEKYFILAGGEPIDSVKSLALKITEMRPEVFRHHVNENKNDFAVWLKDVFGYESLAQEIAATNDQKNIQILLMKHELENTPRRNI